MPSPEMILPSRPFRVEFEVTGACNLDCVYCYAQPLTGYNPPIEELARIFKRTKDEADPFEVVLLGGEPFARKDMLDVLEIASGTFSVGVGISTNGTLIPQLAAPQMLRLRRMTEFGCSLQVSIDSLDPEVNGRTRGRTEQAVAGLRALEDSGIPFSVGMVLTTANIGDASRSIERMLRDFRYLTSLNLEPPQPTARLGARYHLLKPDPGVMARVKDRAISAAKELGRRDVGIVGLTEECEAPGNKEVPLLNTYGFKSCTAGLLRSGVLPNGDVVPCVTLRDAVLGNLRKEGWDEIWQRARERYINLDAEEGQCFSSLLRKCDKDCAKRADAPHKRVIRA